MVRDTLRENGLDELFSQKVIAGLQARPRPLEEVDGYCDGNWLSVAGAGLLKSEMLLEAGYDPEQVSGYGFGMGLERLVQIRDGSEDIRDLWKAPYV